MTGNVYTSNTGMCSHNHCCHGKSISIMYSKRVSVALDIQHPQHMCHIMYNVICSLPGSAKFFQIILQTARFSKESY
jgi:hypothetical protein